MLTPDDLAKLIIQLKRHEGTKRDPAGLHIAYRCTANALTIGYGHNLDANPLLGLGKDSRIKDELAESILISDIKAFATELAKALPWVEKLDGARHGVLINMAFNMGLKALLGFKNTLDLIKDGKYEQAAAGMMASKWAGQVGRRAAELSQQMRAGVWA